MASKNIKLVTYAGSTVTPQDDALIHETAIPKSGIIYGGKTTKKTNNMLHIAAGHGIVCGRKFTISECDVPVQLTGGASHNGRVYIHMDLSNSTNPIQILIETGTQLSSEIQQKDVNILNGVYEFNLATFMVDATTIYNVVDVFPVVSGKDMSELEKTFVKKRDILKTMEEVSANKDADKVVGPEAVKELSNDLIAINDSGAIKGLDAREDGVYITYSPTGGADTVTKKLGSPIPVESFTIPDSKFGTNESDYSPYVFISIAGLSRVSFNMGKDHYGTEYTATVFYFDGTTKEVGRITGRGAQNKQIDITFDKAPKCIKFMGNSDSTGPIYMISNFTGYTD